METTLDRFGRVVIPKAVRKRMGITAGQTLEIEVAYDELVLKPVRPAAGLELRDGLLVYCGGEIEGDPGDMVREDRDRRIAKFTER